MATWRDWIWDNLQDVLDSDRAVCVYCKREYLKHNQAIHDYERYYPEWKWDLGNVDVGLAGKYTPDRSAICPCSVDAVIGSKTATWTRQQINEWHAETWGT